MVKISCDMCGKDIKQAKDLVVTTYALFFILRKFHNACYANREKTAGGFLFVGSKPINTKIYSYVTIFFLLVASLAFILVYMFNPLARSLGALYFTGAVLLVLVILYPRLASYYKYEKPLSGKKIS